MNTMIRPSKSGAEIPFWPAIGKPGLVPLNALVPGTFQPRLFFDPDEQTRLADTIRGGKQREILTVRHLTHAELKSGSFPSPARYMIISGERRWRSADEAGEPLIEIRVKEYGSEADEAEDAYMLNEARVNLTDIENARALRRLADLKRWRTNAEIGKQVGKSEVYVSDMFMLLNLSPEAQLRFDPKLSKRDGRLVREEGLYLSKQPHDTQNDLLARMPHDLVSSKARIAWMAAELKKQGIQLPTRRREPRRMREIVAYLAGYIVTHTRLLEAEDSFDRLLENTTAEVLQTFLAKLTNAQANLDHLVERVESLARGRGQSAPRPPIGTTPLVRSSSVVTRPAPKPVAKLPSKSAWSLAPVTPPRKLNDGKAAVEPTTNLGQTKTPTSVNGQHSSNGASKQITVNAVGSSGRIELKVFTPIQYVAAMDKGELEYQQKGRPKPSHLPGREEALHMTNNK